MDTPPVPKGAEGPAEPLRSGALDKGGVPVDRCVSGAADTWMESREMLRVRQFRYGADNLGYLVYGDRQALAIDGGAVASILGFLREHRLELACATHTHRHPDHTCGTADLVRETGAEMLHFDDPAGSTEVVIEDEPIRILPTPGHTADSICFHVGGFLITGDTLFNGTIGNCFSGDLAGFYRSIQKLLTFPDDTVIYAGHDYVRESMSFARHLEPACPAIAPYLARYTPTHVRTRLGDERSVNPYLRFDDPVIVDLLRQREMAVSRSYERWTSMMSIG
jgi:hydroxyacylglutathione hydrolase